MGCRGQPTIILTSVLKTYYSKKIRFIFPIVMAVTTMPQRHFLFFCCWDNISSVFVKCFTKCAYPWRTLKNIQKSHFYNVSRAKLYCQELHCAKSVQIRTGNNSVFGHFSRSANGTYIVLVQVWLSTSLTELNIWYKKLCIRVASRVF